MSKTTTSQEREMTADAFYPTPEQAAREILRHHMRHGGSLVITYGNREITAVVLAVSKHATKVLDINTNHTENLALMAIEGIEEI